MLNSMVDDNSFYTVITGVVAGLLSAVAYSVICKLFHYFSPKERFQRRVIAYCRQAICALRERFHIDVGKSSLFELTPTLSTESYIYCLFETYLVLNGSTGVEKYPNDETFKTTAKLWYNEWNKVRMANSVEFISPSEMNWLVIEVNSYGVNGRTWIDKHLPILSKGYHMVKRFRDKLRSKSEKCCDLLYRDYKLPYNNHLTKINLEMLDSANE